MGDLSEFEVGQTIELGNERKLAVIRFVGDTHFADGDWLGVELEDFSGKNDGAVKGQRYFECEPGRGMFIRPTAATILALPTSKAVKSTSTSVNGGNIRSRPASTLSIGLAMKRQGPVDTTTKRQSIPDPSTRRQSIVDPIAKRRSINAGSPTPTTRPAAVTKTLASPPKSPTKQLIARSSLGNAGLRNHSTAASGKPSTTTVKRTSISGRPSLAPPTSTTPRTSRTSVGLSLNGNSRPALATKRQPVGRLSTMQQGARSGSISSISQDGRNEQASTTESHRIDVLSPPPNDATGHFRSSPTVSRGSAANATLSRELEDLKTKLRLVEKKRIEDRDKLKAMDIVQAERDKFENIIQKLQAKYQPQQQEISDLRKQVKEAESRSERIENDRVDSDTAIEMATLDREMAEETAEVCKMELEALRSRYEEMELEIEILREENFELGKEMSPDERTSQGWMQMERSNERLREALIRLRDMTQEQEAELKTQIQELQKESQELGNIQERYEETKAQLDQSESTVENLKQQLDNALGAEEMIEELSDKIMVLSEQIDELKTVIEDLEALKELNDELELNHIENEKQLQDEVDYMEAMQLEQVRKQGAHEETIQALEYTITRFRELVTNLTSDLEEMRASQQITESEATELSSRSKAMMDLNLRLQASASKAQTKAIEIEVNRLEAQEAVDHLSIIQCFLPDSYSNDRDSVSAYLRIKRIGFKSKLLLGFFKERANGVAVPGHEDDVLACCEVQDKLTWISAMCERFVKFIKTCSLESFGKLKGALYDLDPVERALNGWIDALKRDDLKEQQCASELQRTLALMTHLAEVHITESLEQYAEELHMRALVMQAHLENGLVVISQIKAITQVKVLLSSDADEEDEATAERFMERADTLISQLRTVKVISGKSVHQLKELQSRSLTLDPSTLSSIEHTENLVADLVATSHASGSALLKVVNEEGRTTSFTYDEITRAISPKDSSPFTTLISKLQTVAAQVQNFYALTTTLAQTLEFSSSSQLPPWYLLSQKLRDEATATAAHEEELLRIRDELSEKNTALAMKDKALEESSVNIEVLSKRIEDSGGRREKLRELENTVEISRLKERETATNLHMIRERLTALEEERESWVKQTVQTGALPSPVKAKSNFKQQLSSDGERREEVGRLKSEVAQFEATIRLLRLAGQNASFHTGHDFLVKSLRTQSKVPPLNGLLDYATSDPAKREFSDKRVGSSVTEQETRDPASMRGFGAKDPVLVSYESTDVMKSMVEAITSPKSLSTFVELQSRDRAERLLWRPTKETAGWQAGKQRSDWENWGQWARSLEKNERAWKRQATLKSRKKQMAERIDRKASASIGVKFYGNEFVKIREREVMIEDPDEWTAVEHDLRVV